MIGGAAAVAGTALIPEPARAFFDMGLAHQRAGRLWPLEGEEWLNEAMEKIFRYGSDSKIALAPRQFGKSEMSRAMGHQHLLNYIVNEHIENTRKAMNPVFIVDPEMVDMDALNARTAAQAQLINRFDVRKMTDRMMRTMGIQCPEQYLADPS